MYEVLPLSSLDELSKFDKTKYPPHAFRGRSMRRKIDGEERKRDFLVCHDFRGNYRDDRFIFKDNQKALEFYIPREVLESGTITEFCYFAHQFVTIPPTSWINVMHRYGIKVYGTIITEFDHGKEIHKQLFKSREIMQAAVKQLHAIKSHFNFDGWLVNIEAPVEKEHLPLLKEFVSTLRTADTKVIWYDSVIDTGELKWQNKLCPKNKCFFDVADGFYLNYWWNDVGLTESRSLAPAEKVYVGIDAFEPRSDKSRIENWPIGGFHCGNPLGKLRQNCSDFSVALFAPGWIIENYCDNLGIHEFRQVHEKCVDFWSQFVEEVKTLELSRPYTSYCEIREVDGDGGEISFKVESYGEQKEVHWYGSDRDTLVKVTLDNSTASFYTDLPFLAVSNDCKLLQLYNPTTDVLLAEFKLPV